MDGAMRADTSPLVLWQMTSIMRRILVNRERLIYESKTLFHVYDRVDFIIDDAVYYLKYL